MTSLSPWVTLLPAALAGTRRQPLAPLPGLTPALGREDGAPEKQLLLTAANLGLVQRASQRPAAGPADRTLPEPETWPVLPDAARPRLAELLAEPLNHPQDRDGDPQLSLLYNGLLDLHQTGYRLPTRSLLPVLRRELPHFADLAQVRQVLGARGCWLQELLGTDLAPWHFTWFMRQYWAREAAAETGTGVGYTRLSQLLRLPPPTTYSYLPSVAALPADQRTQLLWETWQHNSGDTLPAPLQVELDALLAATPPAGRPWLAALHTLTGRSQHPRMAGHPLLAALAEWVAPLLLLERPAGRPPRVRVVLPTAWLPAWSAAGLDTVHSRFGGRPKLEIVLQELLWALGPRHWATAWQLPPAEVVALVAAAPRGRLVLAAWAHSLGHSGSIHTPRPAADPEFARALLALPPRSVEQSLLEELLWHLPATEQAAWLAALLPTDPAVPHPTDWAHTFSLHLYYDNPLLTAPLLRQLLAVLVPALANTRPSSEPGLQLQGVVGYLTLVHLDARLYPELLAAVEAAGPLHPKYAAPLARLLRELALRYQLLQACQPTVATLPTPA